MTSVVAYPLTAGVQAGAKADGLLLAIRLGLRIPSPTFVLDPQTLSLFADGHPVRLPVELQDCGACIARPSFHIPFKQADSVSGIGDSFTFDGSEQFPGAIRSVMSSLERARATVRGGGLKAPVSMLLQPLLTGEGGLLHAGGLLFGERLIVRLAWRREGPAAVVAGTEPANELAVVGLRPLKLVGTPADVHVATDVLGPPVLRELALACQALARATKGPVEVEWVHTIRREVIVLQVQPLYEPVGDI